MSTQAFIELDEAALVAISGGAGIGDEARAWATWAAQGVQSAADAVYREAVNVPTSAVAGWQLAGQMYGEQATLADRVRAMRAVHGVLAASPTVPAWARRSP